MRNFTAAMAVAALAIAPVVANAASTAPLTTGKPAGVHKAQLLEGNTALIVVGAVVVGVAIAAGVSQNSSTPIGVAGVSATST